MRNAAWVGMFVGSTLGSFIPSLWGAGFLSLSAIVFTALGGFIGIWLGYKFSGY